MYLENSEDEEFNRFENELIKANKIKLQQYAEPNYKSFAFNGSKQ